MKSVVTPTSGSARARWRLPLLLVLLAVLAAIMLRWGVLHYMVATGQLAIKQRQLGTAETWLRRAESWGDRSGEVAFYRARLARLRGDSEESQRQLELANRQGYDREEIRREALMGIAQLGDLDPLMKELHVVFADDTKDQGEVMSAAMTGLERTGQYGEGLQLAEFWLAADSEDPRAYYHQGHLFRLRGEAELAHSAFTRALELNPRWIDAMLGLAATEADLNQYEEALHLFQRVRAADPNHQEAMLGEGLALLELQRLDEAREVLASLVAQQETSYRGRLALARTLQALDRHQEAIEILQPLLTRYPQDLEVNRLLAQSHTILGEPSAAERYGAIVAEGEAALAEGPRYEEFAKQRGDDFELLMLGVRQLAPYQLERAQSLLQRAQRANPAAAEPLRLLAAIYERRGDERQASWYRREARRISLDSVTPPEDPAAANQSAAPDQVPQGPDQVPQGPAAPVNSPATSDGARPPEALQVPPATQTDRAESLPSATVP